MYIDAHRNNAIFQNYENCNIEIEKDLREIFPKEQWLELHLRIISYGRKYLKARDIPENVSDAWGDLEKNVENFRSL